MEMESRADDAGVSKDRAKDMDSLTEYVGKLSVVLFDCLSVVNCF